MRDRLIELIRDCCKYEHCLGKGDLNICKNQCDSTSNLADHLLENGVIVLPCLREWNSDGLWCGYELLYDDKGTFTVIHFGKSQKEDAIKIIEEIKAEKALAERIGE